MNQDITGKKVVVLVRGNPDDHNPDPIQHFINQNQIEVLGEWFYDWRPGDGNWAFRRYEDRLAFTKGVERGVNCIIVEPNFFLSIGQTSRFQQRLIMKMMEKLNMPLVSITGTFDSLRYHHLYHSLLDLDGSSFATVGPSDLNFKLQLNLTFASSINSVVTVGVLFCQALIFPYHRG